MVKYMITILLLSVCLNLLAPEYHTIPIQQAEKIKVYDPILYAFMFVESSFVKDTVNSLNAGGILQIRPEMIAEVNRILVLTGGVPKYVLDDRLDSVKSVQIWRIVQSYWNPGYDLKRAAKVWNPLASAEYLKRIKKHL
jgi:hypothetical protein